LNHVFPEFSQQTALHAAAQEGHLATVHLLVQSGAQLDAMDCEQLTPLMQAVLAGHAAVVKYLVKAGASLVLKVCDK
jgi:ankyrin repeat protein